MEKMYNLRALIQKRKTLDEQIKKQSSEIRLFGHYSKDNKIVVGTMNNEEFSAKIVSDIQSLNDKIAIREKVNKALLDANATNMVKVKKFISLGKVSDEYEEISLANAINRKSYYTNVLSEICTTLARKYNSDVSNYNKAIETAKNSTQRILESRFAGATNINQENYSKVRDEEFERLIPVIIDPLKGDEFLNNAHDTLMEYISTIDALLSERTENIKVPLDLGEN